MDRAMLVGFHSKSLRLDLIWVGFAGFFGPVPYAVLPVSDSGGASCA